MSGGRATGYAPGDPVVLTETGERGVVLGGMVPRFSRDDPVEYVVEVGRSLPAVVEAGGLERLPDAERSDS